MRFTKIELVFVTVIILVMVFGIRSYQNRNQTRLKTVIAAGTNSAEAIQQTEIAPAPIARESSDGSVIVRDKGASFKMAPASNKQPVIVTEQKIRSLSRQ